MREFYIDARKLLDPQSPDTPSQLYCYSSNSDRTLGSAQSFLLGTTWPLLWHNGSSNTEQRLLS